MYRYIFLSLIVSLVVVFASSKNIENKISLNKIILQKKQIQKKNTKNKIKNLASSIQSEENIFNDIEYNLNKVSNNILLNKLKLQKAKKDIERLDKKTITLKTHISELEEEIVDSIIEKYSITLGKNLIDKQSLNGIIEKEKYNLILDNTKDTILKSNLNYFKLSNDKRKNDVRKEELEKFIYEQEKKKKRFIKLKGKQQLSLIKLKSKHKKYQNKLKSIINKQFKISNLLDKLNILKKDKIQKARLAKLKEKRRLKKLKEAKLKKQKALLAKQKKKKVTKKIKMKKENHKVTIINSKDIKFSSKKSFQDDIDLKVRNIGSTSKGIKISSYRGFKTIAPLKSYKIIKKFGEFYDPVYKIKLFNESISLKSKIPNAKVYSVLKGKVVYAKHDAGELGNVVIVKHNNNLHTIYSQLSNIPSTLRVGKWIAKGYVVGRVKEILVFQATRNNRYLNPQKLFR